MQSLCSHHAVIVQSSCSHHAVTTQSCCSHCAVIILSFCNHHAGIVEALCSHHAVITQSTRRHCAVIMQSLCNHHAVTCAAVSVCWLFHKQTDTELQLSSLVVFLLGTVGRGGDTCIIGGDTHISGVDTCTYDTTGMEAEIATVPAGRRAEGHLWRAEARCGGHVHADALSGS